MADYWWAVLGLVLIIEGVAPLLFPNRWRSYLKKIAEQPTAQMQQLGGILVIAGVLLLIFFAP
ncbi:DUF2065 domain-containing protein [Rheinheimera mesophila]|uniref:DUF2065 domain-containing protein n=1 Tax=Rheinheimera mesophila TaxID=1547515 RepID=A0A3P3QRH1_9GAMM|nr:DUF2065 domain-containing protein [Rheinheimera mesophila]KKL01431.1 membrane protein [Rheinheimera mesophila]RRJ23797.1 DUF2065 domain-containing protein [Rheinheimera mesophila]